MSYPLVSVIIPVHEEEENLKFSLDSLFSQTYQNFEIIAVCDSLKMFRVLETFTLYPRFKVLFDDNKQLSETILISHASSGRKIGIGKSSGEFIIDFSAHAFAEKNFILTLVKEYQRLNDESVSSIGCSFEFYCDKGFFTRVFYMLWSLGARCPRNDGYVDNIWFGLRRKEIMEKLDYGGDTELNILTRRLGYKKYFTTKTKVYYLCKRSGVWNLFKRAINYGNSRQKHLEKYSDSKEMVKYMAIAVISFFTGYGVGFFLGILGMDVRRIGL